MWSCEFTRLPGRWKWRGGEGRGGCGGVIELRRQLLCDCMMSFSSFSLHSLSAPSSVFFSFSLSASGLVWENRGDRQHAKPRLCQEVHPRLLLWGEAEPSLWRVSYSVWSGLLRTHTKGPPSSNPVTQFFLSLKLEHPLLQFTSSIFPFKLSPPFPVSHFLSLTVSSLLSAPLSPAPSWGIIHRSSVYIVIHWREIGIRVINISYKVLSLIFLLLSKANVWNRVP